MHPTCADGSIGCPVSNCQLGNDDTLYVGHHHLSCFVVARTNRRFSRAVAPVEVVTGLHCGPECSPCFLRAIPRHERTTYLDSWLAALITGYSQILHNKHVILEVSEEPHAMLFDVNGEGLLSISYRGLTLAPQVQEDLKTALMDAARSLLKALSSETRFLAVSPKPRRPRQAAVDRCKHCWLSIVESRHEGQSTSGVKRFRVNQTLPEIGRLSLRQVHNEATASPCSLTRSKR
jgi:hypothetical protein